jgi:hypothetical protein
MTDTKRATRCDAKNWVLREDTALDLAKSKAKALQERITNAWKEPGTVHAPIDPRVDQTRADAREGAKPEREAETRLDALVEFAPSLEEAKRRAEALRKAANGSR